LLKAAGPTNAALVDGVISAEACAAAAMEGIRKETFCILPHPKVADYMRNKTADYDRWIAGMAKLRRALKAPPKAPGA
jgi:hypothetical protein